MGRQRAFVASHDIDHAAEPGAFADGDHHGHAMAAVGVLEELDRFVKIGVFPVQLVDKKGAGHVEPLRVLPGIVHAHLHAGRGVHDDHHAVHQRHRRGDLAQEIHVTGMIDQVDTAALPLAMGQGHGDTVLALDFFFEIVAHRIPVFNRTQAAGQAHLVQNVFDEHRFSDAAVTYNADVAYFPRFNCCHGKTSGTGWPDKRTGWLR